MSQVPNLYQPQYSFHGFSVNNPNAQQPGNQLDQEFSLIKNSLNATISRLSEIQQDDGALKMSQAQAAALAAASEGVLEAAADAAVQAAAGGSHTHAISAITGLQGALNAKADEVALVNGLANKAPSSHTHPISEVLLLQDALDGKAAASHTHGIADITGLPAQLYGRLIQVDLLTSGTGTYTPPTGAKSIYVELQGGGGSGGGVGPVGAGGVICASGGGGGGFCAKFFSSIGPSYPYSVGAAGAPTVAGSAAGNAGGSTTFDTMTASGGSGGVVSSSFGSWIQSAGGLGGNASGGQLNVKGQKAGNAVMHTSFVAFSNGGSSHLGLGGSSTLNLAGEAGSGYGAGGGGICSYGYPGAQTSKAGAGGSPGIIRVWVFG